MHNVLRVVSTLTINTDINKHCGMMTQKKILIFETLHTPAVFIKLIFSITSSFKLEYCSNQIG